MSRASTSHGRYLILSHTLIRRIFILLRGEDNDLHFRDEQHLTATKASSITGNTIFATQVHSGLTALWFNSGHP